MSMKKDAKIRPPGPKGVKQYPGCMGTILNLFDFGQSNGKKYLTDNSHTERTETTRSTLGVSEADHVTQNSEEDMGNYLSAAISKKKKKGGVPMKTLIAEEMSKETESKRRTPSVVARLMGIDAYPSDSMLAKHMQSPGRESTDLTMKHRAQGQGKGSCDPVKASPKLVPSMNKEIAFPKSPSKTSKHKNKWVSPDAHDKPPEKQKHHPKKELEEAKGTGGHDSPRNRQLDALSLQLDQKRILVQETLNEAKIAIARKKVSDAKHLSSDKSLQSKEFRDALGVLKSNKELFLQFIEEPNSVFGRPLQDLKFSSYLSSEPKKNQKGRSESLPVKDKEMRTEHLGPTKRPTTHTAKDRFLQRQDGRKASGQKVGEWCSINQSPSLKDQKKQYKRRDNATATKDASLPTRIVVLKPGSGSVHSDRYALPQSTSVESRTSQRHTNEDEKATTRQFLEEIRQRLRSGLKDDEKERFKFSQKNVCSQSSDEPKDPREIAREIARQVRESVTRDLSKSYYKAGPQSRIKRTEGVSTHSSGKATGSSESTVNREAKKRLSQRLKNAPVNEEDPQSTRIPDTLGRMLALSEDNNSNFQRHSGDEKSNDVLYTESKRISLPKGGEWGAGGESQRYETESQIKSAREIENQIKSSKNIPSVTTEALVCEYPDRVMETETARVNKTIDSDIHIDGFPKDEKSHMESLTLSHSFSHKRDVSVSEKLDFASKRYSSIVEMEEEQENTVILEHQQVHKELISAKSIEEKPSSCVLDNSKSESKLANLDCSQELTVEPLECASPAKDSLVKSSGDLCPKTEDNLEEQRQSTSPTCSSPPTQVPSVHEKSTVTNNEKAEHSSPISVLEFPFQAETHSPQCFKQINSNLQELRLHLRLLKFDGSERLDSTTENEVEQAFDDFEYPEADMLSEGTCNFPSEAALSPVSRPSISMSEMNFDSLPLDDIQCPDDRILALQYVRTVLVASGFSSDRVFACWHSPNQPLDPSLREKVETLFEIDGNDEENCQIRWDHVLLFDCTNEVLIRVLGPYLNNRPWVRNIKESISRMPTGKQLLKETWAEINYFMDTEWESSNILENIIERDLQRERTWLDVRNDLDGVAYEIDKCIFNELVEEVICDIFQ
eukprot:TRINITY_DN8536_c0_g1_i2.p1 TRINITY_DN8536_c0_g1~~TRINITY_DN8536_c0_g1_i2.p1  ORF type:complete len:1123 (+),score=248.03 TRINITY_DN8536_c0_g1_i2:679-4047(+)